MHYLIVGLGNIGPEYQHTKHNIGFDIVDNLAQDAGVRFTDKRYGAIADLSIKNRHLTLLKPSTYMNLSGLAVRYWMQAENIPLENLLVIVDDLSLPFGKLLLRPGGSDGGHNGLKHIQQTLNTDRYARLRFGIGNDYPKGHQIDYVLSGWSAEQLKTLPDHIQLACEIIQQFCLSGIEQTMNDYNRR